MIELNPRTTALVLIDLQNGIVGLSLEPRDGPTVAAAGCALAGRFRAAGAPVFLVRVGWSPDFGDALHQPVDRSFPDPDGRPPPGWGDFVEGLAEPGDIEIVKRQWGAFHGTELDLQLRRRGIATVVLAGIATNFGVESTARQAWEFGYAVVFAEDAMAGPSAPLHDMAVRQIMPLIGRVATSATVSLTQSSRL